MENSPLMAKPISEIAPVPEKKNSALAAASNSIFLYEFGIPAALALEMDALYESLFSSSAMLGALYDPSTLCGYVVREAGRAKTIFSYRLDGKKVVVLNEQITLNAGELNKFSGYLFSRFPAVRKIVFKAIQTGDGKISGFHQQVNFSNDIVLSLPDSTEKYMASLGKSTRENIRRSLKIAKRDFPSFTFELKERTAATENFHRIVAFNRARMVGKNKVPGIHEKEEGKLLALVEQCGLVGTISLEGRVCGGVICYQVGRNYFVRVIAHDSAYNSYSLGLLSCYLSICACIARGGREYHFLWGQEEYKFRLLGKRRDFDLLTIYRSPLSFLLDSRTIMKTACDAALRKLKTWLLDPANQNDAIPRLAHQCVHLLRTIRGRK